MKINIEFDDTEIPAVIARLQGMIPPVKSAGVVQLDAVPDNFVIPVIKAIRAGTGMGLKEAKEITDAARGGRYPIVAERLASGAAYALASDIRRAGAEVTWRE